MKKVYVKLTEDEANYYGLNANKQYDGMFNWILYDYEKIIMVRGCRTWINDKTSIEKYQYCIDDLTQSFFDDMEDYVNSHMYFSFRQLIIDQIFREHIPTDITADNIIT